MPVILPEYFLNQTKISIVNKHDFDNIKDRLSKFEAIDFNLFIPQTMMGLSSEEILTVQFAFWFCHAVERDLDNILKVSFKNMEEALGKTPVELLDFIKKYHGISFEKVDPDHPDYDQGKIYFNDRIDIVEKLCGKSEHTKFLRKVKEIRNDLAHGRISMLAYEGINLCDPEAKRRLLFDYVKQALTIDEMPKEGGFVNDLTQEQNKEIDVIYKNWLDSKKMGDK